MTLEERLASRDEEQHRDEDHHKERDHQAVTFPVLPALPPTAHTAQLPVAQRERPTEDYLRVTPAYNRTQVTYLALGIIEILLGLRVALKALAASPNAGFSRALYAITSPLVVPFQGVFPNPHTHGSSFELSTLLAILIYAILAWLIVRILLVVNRRAPTPTV
jgi:hypothetical protein